jgi:hypothetical protein
MNGFTLACVFLVVLGIFAGGAALDHRREQGRQAFEDEP